MNMDSTILIAWLGALLGVGLILQGSKKRGTKSKKAEDDDELPQNNGKRFMIVTGILLVIISFLVIFIKLYVA